MLIWLITALKMESNGCGEPRTPVPCWWEYKTAAAITSCAGALQKQALGDHRAPKSTSRHTPKRVPTGLWKRALCTEAHATYDKKEEAARVTRDS